MPAKNSVIAIYGRMSAVEGALAELHNSGVPKETISVVAQDLHSDKTIHGIVFEDHPTLHGGTNGAWIGGIFGLTVGLAVAWVPGVGPFIAAGPIAASIASVLEGAVLGASGIGLLGALVSWGVSESQMHQYEKMVRNGKYLVIVHGDTDAVSAAEDVLRGTAPDLIDVHGLS
ncbi:MAG: hypothetical protein KF753_15325 [Caldilineaceae bacterium]|nr:hypothetical protein [Caldilineaceae bacterium]